MLILLGVACLLRVSELVALKFADIKFHKHHASITVRRSKTDQGGKGVTLLTGCVSEPGCKVSHCPFHRLRDFAEGRNPSALLFSTSKSEAQKAIKDLIMRTSTAATGRMSSHSLRRTGVVLLLENGVTVTKIAELGRWASTSMVENVYSRDNHTKDAFQVSAAKMMLEDARRMKLCTNQSILVSLRVFKSTDPTYLIACPCPSLPSPLLSSIGVATGGASEKSPSAFRSPTDIVSRGCLGEACSLSTN